MKTRSLSAALAAVTAVASAIAVAPPAQAAMKPVLNDGSSVRVDMCRLRAPVMGNDAVLFRVHNNEGGKAAIENGTIMGPHGSGYAFGSYSEQAKGIVNGLNDRRKGYMYTNPYRQLWAGDGTWTVTTHMRYSAFPLTETFRGKVRWAGLPVC